MTINFEMETDARPVDVMTLHENAGPELRGNAPRVAVELKTLQKAVGGFIEILPFPREMLSTGRTALMVINESGKLEGLPVNPLATVLAVSYIGLRGDVIVGPALLVTQSRDGRFHTLTAREEQEILFGAALALTGPEIPEDL